MFVCPVPKISQVMMKRRRRATISKGSFENEALENEDRSTKHPNLENEAPKSRIENEAPKTRKRRPQNSQTKHSKLENEDP